MEKKNESQKKKVRQIKGVNVGERINRRRIVFQIYGRGLRTKGRN